VEVVSPRGAIIDERLHSRDIRQRQSRDYSADILHAQQKSTGRTLEVRTQAYIRHHVNCRPLDACEHAPTRGGTNSRAAVNDAAARNYGVPTESDD